MSRYDKLGHMFDSPDLGSWLKVRLYCTTVVSLLAFGCESWNLTQTVMRKLNGCNSQMLVRVTGNSVQTEARSTISSFDLVKHIRVRRLRWLVEILKDNPERPLFKTVTTQHTMNNPGNLFSYGTTREL